ncbi:MAG: STAS domain-containing protein [Planctomycetota bacterium]|jgi:anti-anti-sigma factor
MAEIKTDVVAFQQMGDVTVGALRAGEITQKVGDMLQAKLHEMQGRSQGVKLVLDLSRLDFLGSVGLSILVVMLQRVKKGGGRLALVGLTGFCRDVMHVTGLEKAFEMHEDVPGALDALSRV